MTAPILRAVCSAMERIAPLRLAEKWDNVGLLLGETFRGIARHYIHVAVESPVQRPNRKHVLLTIDLTTSVLNESLQNDTAVIVSYHPTIFKPLQSLTLSNPLQTSLLKCAVEGISIFSPHTALDSVWGGVNDWLAKGIVLGGQNGDGDISALVSEKFKPGAGMEQSEGGEGRLVTLKQPISLDTLIQRVKTGLGMPTVQVGYAHDITPQENSDGYSVKTVAICAGSGGSMLLGRQADVYFTGEMSHHEVLAAVASGRHVILCGHTNTERGYLPALAAKLRDELTQDGLAGVDVRVSQRDRHPLQYV